MFLFFYSCTVDKETPPSLSIQSELRDSDLCNLSNDGCDSTQIDTTINISGCLIPVSYTRYICPVTGGIDIRIGNLDYSLFLPNSIDCDSIENVWYNHFVNNNVTAAHNAILAFNKSLTIAIETSEINKYLLEYPGNYNCNSSAGAIVLYGSFIEKNCSTLCGEYNEFYGRWDLKRVKCGELCCLRRTRYCYTNGVLTPTLLGYTPGSPGYCVASETINCRGTYGTCRESCEGL